MSNNIPKTMLAGGATALLVDTGLSVWNLQETLAVNGNNGVALLIAAGIGVIVFSLLITLFINGLELAHKPSSPQKSASLSAIFVVATAFALVSANFNLDRVAGDLMHKLSTQQGFDERIEVKGNVEEALKQAFDQKSNIVSVHETANQWHQCEIQSSCISEQGRGEGQVSGLLKSIAITARHAESALTDLEAEIEPLLKKANHYIHLFDEVEHIIDLDFDGKEERRSELSEKLHETVVELQALIPVSVFNGLEKELGKSTATYRSLNISDSAAKRIRTKFQPYADEFASQATLLRKAQHYYMPPVRKLSRIEILTASSDVTPYFLMSIAIAFGTWMLLAIHIISAEKRPEDQEPPSNPPGANPSVHRDSFTDLDAVRLATKH
tara:strand:+ start:6140 stop:7288 length:1149 start_codon:yes stop_codon:yes gene_type:complete